LCATADAPEPGRVMEAEARGIAVCVANVGGELSAVANRCPHRGGQLGQGVLEGESVVCPWHAWTFNVKTGLAEFPPHERVAVFPVRVEGGDVLVDLGTAGGNQPWNIAGGGS
jgi:nitrite reductase (NADH) small subunit